jgi:transposase-like protein
MAVYNDNKIKLSNDGNLESSIPAGFFLLSKAAQMCSYSQEYLSLLARRGELKAQKIDRKWHTTQKWLEEYVARHSNTNKGHFKGEMLEDSHQINEIRQNFFNQQLSKSLQQSVSKLKKWVVATHKNAKRSILSLKHTKIVSHDQTDINQQIFSNIEKISSTKKNERSKHPALPAEHEYYPLRENANRAILDQINEIIERLIKKVTLISYLEWIIGSSRQGVAHLGFKIKLAIKSLAQMPAYSLKYRQVLPWQHHAKVATVSLATLLLLATICLAQTKPIKISSLYDASSDQVISLVDGGKVAGAESISWSKRVVAGTLGTAQKISSLHRTASNLLAVKTKVNDMAVVPGKQAVKKITEFSSSLKMDIFVNRKTWIKPKRARFITQKFVSLQPWPIDQVLNNDQKIKAVFNQTKERLDDTKFAVGFLYQSLAKAITEQNYRIVSLMSIIRNPTEVKQKAADGASSSHLVIDSMEDRLGDGYLKLLSFLNISPKFSGYTTDKIIIGRIQYDGSIVYVGDKQVIVKGTPGPAGPAGEKGEKGDSGKKGESGLAGEQGSAGQTGSVTNIYNVGAPGATAKDGAGSAFSAKYGAFDSLSVTDLATIEDLIVTDSATFQSAVTMQAGLSVTGGLSAANLSTAGYLSVGSGTPDWALVSGRGYFSSDLEVDGALRIDTATTSVPALLVSGTPVSSSALALVNIGPNNISGGSASGTFLAANPIAFSGDFLNFQVGDSSIFKVDNAGNLTMAGSTTQQGGLIIEATSTPQFIVRYDTDHAWRSSADNQGTLTWDLTSATNTPVFAFVDPITLATTTTIDLFSITASTTEHFLDLTGSSTDVMIAVNQKSNGDLFKLQTNDVTKFLVTNAGNVGIGVITPMAMLHASSTSGAVPALILQGTVSQSANLLENRNNSSTFLSGFTGSGGLLMNIASSTAVVIQDGLGINEFVIDTSSDTATTTISDSFIVNTNQLYVDSITGNVGIGNTSATSTLSVIGSAYFQGNATTTGYLTVGLASPTYLDFSAGDLLVSNNLEVQGNATTTGSSYIGGDLEVAGIFNQSGASNLATTTVAGNFWATDANQEKSTFFVNNLTGNVGIGTTNPTAMLSVNSSGSNASISNPTPNQGLILSASGNDGAATGQLRIVANNQAWADNATTAYFQIRTLTNNNATFMGGTYGADAPLDRLQFNSEYTTITNNAYTDTPIATALFEVVNDTAARNIMQLVGAGSQSGDYMQITSNGGSAGNILTVNSFGNVGIGTTNPQYKLEVNGNAYFSGNATTSGYMVIGTTQPTMNMSAGDLLIGNNATTTQSHYIGGDFQIAGISIFTGLNTFNTGFISNASSTQIGNWRVDGNATTTGTQIVSGSLGIATTTLPYALNVTGAGYVTGDWRVGGTSYFTGGASFNSVTSTDSLYLGGFQQFTETGDNFIYFDNAQTNYLAWDDDPGEFDLAGNLNISGSATTTGAFYAGTDNLVVLEGGNVGIGTTTPSQELDIVGDINLENTTTADTGIIYKNGTSFIHNFQHPTGNTAVPVGRNTFVGITAGNLTMGSTATDVTHSSYNTAVGQSALASNTLGYGNVAVGNMAMYSNSTGYHNVAFGRNALSENRSTAFNVAVGAFALVGNMPSGGYNTAIGGYSLYSMTTGSNNIAMGYNSGRYITGGSTANLTGDYSIFIGRDTKALADNDQNEIVIGYNATGIGSNTVTLGNDSITTTALKGNVGIGTTGPDGKLSISSSVDQPYIFNLTNTYSGQENNYQFRMLSDKGLNIYGGSSSSYFRFGVGGSATDGMIINSDGNVGIGTTGPGAKLHIQESATGSWAVKLSNRNNNQTWGIGVDTQAIDDGTFTIQDITGVTNIFNIDTSGNVGIMDFSPDANLEVVDDFMVSSAAANDGDLFIVQSGGNVGIGTTDPGANTPTGFGGSNPKILEVKGGSGGDGGITISGGTNYGHIWYDDSLAHMYIDNTYNSGEATYGDIRFRTDTSDTLVDAMTIKYNGNVGIGTTGPNAQLSFGKIANQTDLVTYANSDQANIQFYQAQNFPDSGVYDRVLDINAGASNAGSNIRFLTGHDNEAGQSRMIINSRGNVGIGTTAPGYKLHVDTAGTQARFSNTALQYLDISDWGSASKYLTTPGHLGIRTAGGTYTNVVFANSGVTYFNSGNVGIGSTTPAQKLSVDGKVYATEGFQLPDGYVLDDEGDLTGSLTHTQTYVGNSSGIATATSTLTVTDAGLVGIGTTAPETKLHVDSSINGSGIAMQIDFGGLGTDKGLVIDSPNSGSGDGLNIQRVGSSYFRVNPGSNWGKITFDSAGASAGGQINTESSEPLVLQATAGNVGIGTTAPGAKLDIDAGSSYPLSVDSTQKYLIELKKSGAAEWYLASENSNLLFHKSGIGDTVTFQTDGNVGIGTTAPINLLQIVGGNTGTPSTSGVPTAGSLVVTTGTTGDQGIVFGKISGSSNNWIQVQSTGNAGIANGALLLQPNNGNVGIGTTGPLSAFQVGSQAVLGSVYTARIFGANTAMDNVGNANLLIATTDATAVDKGGSLAFGGNNPTNNFVFSRISGRSEAANYAGYLAFETVSDNGTFAEKMRINSSGNVGIGTTGPGNKLVVEGAVVVSGSRADSGDGIFLDYNGSRGLLLFYDYGGSGYKTSSYDSSAHNFFVSGSQKVIFDNTGNVGIGTTDPGGILEVYKAGSNEVILGSDSGGVSWLKFEEGGSTRGYFGHGADSLLTEATADSMILRSEAAIHFGTNGNNLRMTIDEANGNVGIGTTDPGAQLHISGTDTTDQVIFENTDTGSGSAPDLVFYRNSSSPAVNDLLGRIDLRGKNDNISSEDINYVYMYGTILDETDGTEDAKFQINTFINGADNERFTIRNDEIVLNEAGIDLDTRIEASGASSALFVEGSSGNVGIGTTGPENKLHIYGTEPALMIESSSAYSTPPSASINTRFNYASAGSLTADSKVIEFGKENDTDGNTAGFLAFYKKPAGAASAEAVRIDSNGNVGIGTTGPASLLNLNGSYNLAGGLSFGDGDTGIYETEDDFLGVKVNEIASGLFTTTGYSASGGTTGNAKVHINVASDVVPAFTFNGDFNTGIGRADADQLSLIAGGVEALRASTTGAVANVLIMNGNVGIGTTNPLQTFHVNGQCMTGDTLIAIRRRRRKKKLDSDNDSDDDISDNPLNSTDPQKSDDDYDYMLVRIDQILPGDEVLSLNEATNEVEYHKVNALMDMGVKDIYEIKTKSGRVIRTTANHPYLARLQKQTKKGSIISRLNPSEFTSKLKQKNITISEGKAEITRNREVNPYRNREVLVQNTKKSVNISQNNRIENSGLLKENKKNANISDSFDKVLPVGDRIKDCHLNNDKIIHNSTIADNKLPKISQKTDNKEPRIPMSIEKKVEIKKYLLDIYCPYCASKKYTKRGTREKKKERVQLYICSDCSRTFTPGIIKGKHYPTSYIYDAISLYNLGYSLEKSCQIVNQIAEHKKELNVTISPSSLANWLEQYSELCAYSRMRSFGMAMYPPERIVESLTLAHKQLYKFRHHKAKTHLIIEEDYKHHKFTPLKEFLELVPSECPHTYFDSTDSQRASNAPVFFSKSDMIVRSKQNYATKVAGHILDSVTRPRDRHDALQRFLLANDSTTVATEVPVYLKGEDLSHMQTELGFQLFEKMGRGIKDLKEISTEKLPKLITGHIDFIQIRNGKIHIMDYKPNAVKIRPIEQLTIYALALSRLTTIRVYNFVCAWFDEKDYFEFFPLHAVLKKKKRRRKVRTAEGVYSLNKDPTRISKLEPD